MSRPADWEPLAASDPVPGDAFQVQQLSAQLRQIAQTISEQADKLTRLTTSEHWDSEASRTFDSTTQKVARDLEQVHKRYEAAYEAVRGYVAPLEDEQAITLGLLRQSQELDAARREAQSRLDEDATRSWTNPDGSAVPVPSRHHVDRQTVDDYQGQLRALQGRMNDSVLRIHTAAQNAAYKIVRAADHDGLKDSFWDKVEHVASQIDQAVMRGLAQLSAVLSKISSVVGVLALLLCWVPGLGELLAGLTVALAGLSLAVDTVLALSGHGSWGKVLMDGVLVVAGSVAKGFQGGFKAVLAGGKLARAADDVLPLIAARGGQATEDVATALRTGDLGGASALSGLGTGKLSRLFGAQLARMTREQGVLGGGRTALLEAASKASFNAADFNPFVNLYEDASSLRSSLDVGRQLSAFSHFLAGGAGSAWRALENVELSGSAVVKSISYLTVQTGLVVHDAADAWLDLRLPLENRIDALGGSHGG